MRTRALRPVHPAAALGALCLSGAWLLPGPLSGGPLPGGPVAAEAAATQEAAAPQDAPLPPLFQLDTLELQAALEARAPIQELLAIYRRIEGLREVHLRIEDGIIELTGTALTQEDRLRAGELAEGVPGIVWVDNRIAVETDLRKRLAPAVDRLHEKGTAFIRFLPVLAVGLLIIGLSVLLAVWAGRVPALAAGSPTNPFARNVARQALRVVIVLTGMLLALDLIGATALVGAVLGAAGIMGIAVGFAFRDIVENYLAGVLLSLRQPFAPNDHLQLAGHEGRVVRLTGRETILMTLDGNHVRIPNAAVFKAVTTNFTRNPRRRFSFSVGVAPWQELGSAIRVAREAVEAVTGVLDQPGISVRVNELQEQGVELRVAGWVDQASVDFSKVRSKAIRAVKEAYEREGVATPPPEYGVRILQGEVPAAEAAPAEPGPSAPATPGPSEPAAPADRSPAPEPESDVSPDTTIEEEIARELESSDEENLLKPPPPGS